MATNDKIHVFVKEVYPVVKKAMDEHPNGFKKAAAKFFVNRHDELFSTIPDSRIYYGESERKDFWNGLGISEAEVEKPMHDLYFWNKPINPGAIKDPTTVAILMIVRYYLKKGNYKDALMAGTYLAFSGKIYASVHTVIFPILPNSAILSYSLNNSLSDKFSITKYHTVFATIQALVDVWLKKYSSDIKSDNSDDDDFKIILQQLRDRVRGFLKNIMNVYKQDYANKDYLNYDSDQLNADGEGVYHLSDSDSTRAARTTEEVVNYLMSNEIDYELLSYFVDQNVTQDEIKQIMQSILGNKDNVNQVRELVNLLIVDYLRAYPGHNIGAIEFMTYSFKKKPNTTNQEYLKEKAIITKMLEKNSADYMRRRKRINTANSYYNGVLSYFVTAINKIANK